MNKLAPVKSQETPGISSDGYVDLNRTFAVQRAAPESEVAAAETYLSFLWLRGDRDRFDWSKVLELPRVLILAEAGSGKTREMEARQKELRDNGKFAFYVPLNELVKGSLYTALGPEGAERFNEWQKSSDVGYVFWDSADEAKIHGVGDFKKALKEARQSFTCEALSRVRLFLSARVSEWNHNDDVALLHQLFGLMWPEKNGHEILLTGESKNEKEALQRRVQERGGAADGP